MYKDLSTAGPYRYEWRLDGSAEAFRHNIQVALTHDEDDQINQALFMMENPLPPSNDPRTVYARLLRGAEKREEKRPPKVCPVCHWQRARNGSCYC